MRIDCQATEHAAAKPFVTANTVLLVGTYANTAGALAFAGLPDAWAHQARERSQLEGFVGARKQQLVLRLPGQKDAVQPGAAIVLLGLGSKDAMASSQWLRVAGTAARLARGMRATKLVLCLPGLADDSQPPLSQILLVAQGLHLGLYRFSACRAAAKGEDGKPQPDPSDATLWVGGGDAALLQECNEAAEVGGVMARAVAQARDWVNLPANLLGPSELAAAAGAQAREVGIGCKVLDEAAMRQEKMGLLLGVGQGSERPPRLVHLTYQGRGASQSAPIVLVGKGIVFDSGGLCIKPCEGMSTMKMDMGGAACVLAVIGAIARLRLPLNVHAIAALAENMPSGHAIRPGDILTSMQGKTVEVNNTDAEGRLVLADAITYAKRLAPAAIVDVATLTGACMVALGPTTAGLFSSDDALAADLQQAAKEAGEDIWRLPLTRSLRDQLKSDCADMRNTGERYGGAITAALFLQEFAGDAVWAHLDIAGPAWGSEDGGHLSKGGTGAAVATLVRWLMRCSQASVPAENKSVRSRTGRPPGRAKAPPRAKGNSRRSGRGG